MVMRRCLAIAASSLLRMIAITSSMSRIAMSSPPPGAAALGAPAAEFAAPPHHLAPMRQEHPSIALSPSVCGGAVHQRHGVDVELLLQRRQPKQLGQQRVRIDAAL